MNEIKYNYVIFQADYDYFRVTYKDAIDMGNVVYIDRLPHTKNLLIYLLYKLHNHPKIRRIVKLPFRNIWFPFICRKIKFKDDKPICFIFSGIKAIWALHGFLSFLKLRYKTAKYVCFFQDIISSFPNVDIQQIKKEFDVVISYDKLDAMKYELFYHPTLFSNVELCSSSHIEECDVFFVGAAKNRLMTLIDYYDKLSANGLKCRFFITGTSLSKDNTRPGIEYINKMSYCDNLKHITKAKAILEILQKGAVGYTLRTWEAISYNKYLVTNNEWISPFILRNSSGIIKVCELETTPREKLSERPWYEPELQRMFSWHDFMCYLNTLLD